MDINRQNYETWFIDYIDGKLDEKARKVFYAFMDANPDLAGELLNFEEIKLEPEAVTFPGKKGLQRTKADLMEIDAPDFLLVKQMEEGLTEEEEKDLARIIRSDESLIKRGEEFQLSRLSADQIEFPNKKSLLHRDLKNVYSIVLRAASVAAVLVLLFIAYQWRIGSTNEMPVAMVPIEKNIPQMKEIEIATDQLSEAKPDFAGEADETGKEQAHGRPEKIYEDVNHKDAGKFQVDQQLSFFKLMSPKSVADVKLPVVIPNAYETGLRQMMPLYLDLNNQRKALVASLERQKASNDRNLLVKGLQLVDRFSGDLVNFDRLYDEDGNYVAYNLKAGNIEMKQKVKH